MERFASAVDGNKYGDAQLDSVQRMGVLGSLNPKLVIFIKSLPSCFREFCRRKDRKIVRASGKGRHQGNKAF